VLAGVLGRDGAELSASEIRQRNLANADHLGILNAIWTAETRDGRNDRYRGLVMATVPPGYRQELSPQAGWLFRTLHIAELAGLDPAEVIRSAIASRDLAGARDIATSSMRGSGNASTRCCRSREAPGPSGSPSCRIRTARPTWPGSRRRWTTAAAHRPARCRDRSRVRGHGPRSGARRPGRPARLGDQGVLDWRLPGDVRL